jgi:hypothetical protein
MLSLPVVYMYLLQIRINNSHPVAGSRCSIWCLVLMFSSALEDVGGGILRWFKDGTIGQWCLGAMSVLGWVCFRVAGIGVVRPRMVGFGVGISARVAGWWQVWDLVSMLGW